MGLLFAVEAGESRRGQLRARIIRLSLAGRHGAVTSCCTAAATGRRLVVGEGIGGDPQVVCEEPGSEPRLVIALQDAFAVDLEHPARANPPSSASRTRAGSTPALRARANASPTAASVPPITI